MLNLYVNKIVFAPVLEKNSVNVRNSRLGRWQLRILIIFLSVTTASCEVEEKRLAQVLNL